MLHVTEIFQDICFVAIFVQNKDICDMKIYEIHTVLFRIVLFVYLFLSFHYHLLYLIYDLTSRFYYNDAFPMLFKCWASVADGDPTALGHKSSVKYK